MNPPAVTPETAIQPGVDPPQPRRFTFEEYCVYEDGTDNRYELAQGYLRLMSPPAGLHVIICEFLVYAFNRLFQQTGTPLWAVREFGVRIQDNTCRIVDICINWQHHWQTMSQSGEKGIFLQNRTPVLVVEVTSTNEKEDEEEKAQEYASIGIPEYWIVNRRQERLRVCTLASPGGTYTCRDFGKGEQIVSTVLPQLELTVDEVLNPPVVRQLLAQEQTQREAEREALQAEKTTIATERDDLKAERDVLEANSATLAAERDEFKMELERLKAAMKAKELDSLL